MLLLNIIEHIISEHPLILKRGPTYDWIFCCVVRYLICLPCSRRECWAMPTWGTRSATSGRWCCSTCSGSSARSSTQRCTPGLTTSGSAWSSFRWNKNYYLCDIKKYSYDWLILPFLQMVCNVSNGILLSLVAWGTKKHTQIRREE